MEVKSIRFNISAKSINKGPNTRWFYKWTYMFDWRTSEKEQDNNKNWQLFVDGASNEQRLSQDMW